MALHIHSTRSPSSLSPTPFVLSLGWQWMVEDSVSPYIVLPSRCSEMLRGGIRKEHKLNGCWLEDVLPVGTARWRNTHKCEYAESSQRTVVSSNIHIIFQLILNYFTQKRQRVLNSTVKKCKVKLYNKFWGPPSGKHISIYLSRFLYEPHHQCIWMPLNLWEFAWVKNE